MIYSYIFVGGQILEKEFPNKIEAFNSLLSLSGRSHTGNAQYLVSERHLTDKEVSILLVLFS
jgi:hypothetical protein